MQTQKRSKNKLNTMINLHTKPKNHLNQPFTTNYQFSGDLKQKFSRQQLHHYHILELQIYELFKYTKSQMSTMSNDRLKVLIQTIQEASDQLEKFCKSLNLLMIYNLFDNLKICLVGISSYLLYLVINKDKKEKQTQKSTFIPFKIQLLKKNRYQDQFGSSKKIDLKAKIKFGGVSLYNENYQRYLEKAQIFYNLEQTEQSQKKKMKELQEIQQYVENKNDQNYQEMKQKNDVLKLDQIPKKFFFSLARSNQLENCAISQLSRIQNDSKRQRSQGVQALLKFMAKKQKKHSSQMKVLEQKIEQRQQMINRLLKVHECKKDKTEKQVQTLPDQKLNKIVQQNEAQATKLRNLEKINMQLNQFIKKKNRQFLQSKNTTIFLKSTVQKHNKDYIKSQKQLEEAKKKITALKNTIIYTKKDYDNIQVKYNTLKQLQSHQAFSICMDENKQSNTAKNGSANYSQGVKSIGQSRITVTKTQKFIGGFSSRKLRPIFKSVRFLKEVKNDFQGGDQKKCYSINSQKSIISLQKPNSIQLAGQKNQQQRKKSIKSQFPTGNINNNNEQHKQNHEKQKDIITNHKNQNKKKSNIRLLNRSNKQAHSINEKNSEGKQKENMSSISSVYKISSKSKEKIVEKKRQLNQKVTSRKQYIITKPGKYNLKQKNTSNFSSSFNNDSLSKKLKKFNPNLTQSDARQQNDYHSFEKINKISKTTDKPQNFRSRQDYLCRFNKLFGNNNQKKNSSVHQRRSKNLFGQNVKHQWTISNNLAFQKLL